MEMDFDLERICHDNHGHERVEENENNEQVPGFCGCTYERCKAKRMPLL